MTPKKLNSKIVAILQPLIEQEYIHFYAYKSSANYCRGAGFMKAAEFYEEESKEEAGHAAMLQKFLTDWNVTFGLPAIAPAPAFTSLVQTIEQAYTREYDLYEKYEQASAAVLEMDTTVFDFLCQFRKIQQDTVAEYSDKLNMIEGCNTDSKFEMLMVEEKLFG